MKNVSIYGKKWLDLVFEGKNKEYGAYQLRQESERTSGFAFIFGTIFLGAFVLLLSSFNEKPSSNTIPDIDEPVVTISNYTPPTEDSKPKTEQPKAIPPTTAEPIIPNGPMVVTKTPDAIPDVPTNADLPEPVTASNGSPSGTVPATTTNTGGTGGNSTVLAPSNNPVPSKELDRQPNYPGGIQNFYQYVGNNFDKDGNYEGETIRVEVSFVIERNGSMTDIRVVKKTNSEIDNEAIRVLKSLRTKWSPGYKDGQPVRTQFTLPISVVL
jgi:protein TonB